MVLLLDMFDRENGENNKNNQIVDNPSHRQRIPCSADSSIASARIPWTSARCNRLLRPISSKIALLRKEIQHENKQSETRHEETHYTYGLQESVGEARRPAAGVCSAPVARGEEWESSLRPRKKIKRTYSSKTRNSQSEGVKEAAADAHVCFPVRQTSIGLPSQLPIQTYSFGDTPNDREIDQTGNTSAPTLRDTHPPPDLPRTLVAGNWKLIDGICKGLLALLKATYLAEPPSAKGGRSLFSTCLRQTPKYIVSEEMLSKAEDPDNEVDISSIVYNELEDFGSVADGGWEPLRELVRAHGLRMITDAIEEGLIGQPIARHLFFLCLDVAACNEAHSIIESFVNLASSTGDSSLRCPKQLPTDLLNIINGLDNLDSRTGKQGIFYRRTAVLLDRGVVPIEWISRKSMISTWNSVICSIAHENQNCHSTALLLKKAVGVSYKLAKISPEKFVHDLRLHARVVANRSMLRSARTSKEEGETMGTTSYDMKYSGHSSHEDVCQTLSNILTVLSAILRIQHLANASNFLQYDSCIMDVIQDLAVEARQAVCMIRHEKPPHESSHPSVELLRLPLLAGGLLEILIHNAKGESFQCEFSALSALASISASKDSINSLSLFICAVARCCELAVPDDSFSIMQAMVEDLIDISRSSIPDRVTRRLCSDLALAAAFAYSEDTSQPNHLDWALHVELNLVGSHTGSSDSPGLPKPAVVRTPARGSIQQRNGYKWEEGICEWIAKTPDMLGQKPRNPKAALNRDDGISRMAEAGVEEADALISETSPCATSKRPKRKAGEVKSGEVRALHVCIKKRINNNVGAVASNKARLTSAYRPPKRKTSNLRKSQGVLQEDDLDELSTPDSSREKSALLCNLPDLANANPNTKRRKLTNVKHIRQEPRQDYPANCKENSFESQHDRDMAEDELALMFS